MRPLKIKLLCWSATAVSVITLFGAFILLCRLMYIADKTNGDVLPETMIWFGIYFLIDAIICGVCMFIAINTSYEEYSG